MRGLVSTLAVLMLVGCAGPKATVPQADKELTRANRLARTAFEDGATSRAADFYNQALHRATAMDDAAEIGNAAYNLALCRIRLEQLDQAGAALVEAEAAFRRSGSNPADVVLLEATVAQRQGRGAQALALADRVLALSPDASRRLQVALLQGTVAWQQGDLEHARTALATADQYQVADVALRAARERLRGSVLGQEGNPAEAAAAFDRAAALFQKARHYREMSLTLRRAGAAYQEAGDTQRAADRLLRAQQSLAAQETTQ